MSEPPIHAVSPQPADFHAAALPDCFHRTLCVCFKKQGFFFKTVKKLIEIVVRLQEKAWSVRERDGGVMNTYSESQGRVANDHM